MLLKEMRMDEWGYVLNKLKEIEKINKGDVFSYPAINWITEKIKEIRTDIEFSIEGTKLTQSDEVNEVLIKEQDHVIEDCKDAIYKMEDELIECSKLYIERHAAMNAARISHEKMLTFRYRRRMTHEEALCVESYRQLFELYEKANDFIIHATEENFKTLLTSK
ncbi:MAG: hypothetical protein ACI35O_12305 [Bacillaceae bacterium]